MDLTLRSESFGQDRRDWLGSAHGTDAPVGATLDVSTFTSGTHYPEGFIKSGIPLGKITSSGKYGPYDNTETDGRETCVGFLFTDVNVVNSRGQASTTVVGSMLLHCFIKEAKLPVAIDAAGKTDLGARVVFV
ncbi:head decoration protein [Streptomyces sp. C10-9-1]|uniref:head decoration protein n=1 Tax=Streptomyces sp. C10-9-1 TaxID=1859285 RepID=UPI0021121F17|nr:head decoration protein [Streptomyces sp. C10-9-1]MCQ6554799.1 head decoration protein [Streptomyces sp. C10-9-1]